MQRIGMLALCVIVALATAWLLLSSGGNSPPDSAGNLDPAQRAADRIQTREDASADAGRSGVAVPGAAAGSAVRNATSGSSGASARSALDGTQNQPTSAASARPGSDELAERARAWAESSPRSDAPDAGRDAAQPWG